MTLLCIIFASPLYFLVRNKWGGFFINSFFYGIACLALISIIGAAFEALPWLIGVFHASFEYRKERAHATIELLTTKMAEKNEAGRLSAASPVRPPQHHEEHAERLIVTNEQLNAEHAKPRLQSPLQYGN